MAEITWIKLDTAIYDDEKIKLFRKKKNGDTFFAIWVQLLTLAGRINNGGAFLLPDGKPYTAEYIASAISREGQGKTVTQALELFISLGMVEIVDGFFYLPNWEKHQNIDGMAKARESARLRKQKQREREKNKKNAQCPDECHANVTQMSHENNSNVTQQNKNKELRIKNLVSQSNARTYTLKEKIAAFEGLTGKKLTDFEAKTIEELDEKQAEIFMKAIEESKQSTFLSGKTDFVPVLPWFVKHMDEIVGGKYRKYETQSNDFKTFELDEFFEAALKRSRTK